MNKIKFIFVCILVLSLSIFKAYSFLKRKSYKLKFFFYKALTNDTMQFDGVPNNVAQMNNFLIKRASVKDVSNKNVKRQLNVHANHVNQMNNFEFKRSLGKEDVKRAFNIKADHIEKQVNVDMQG